MSKPDGGPAFPALETWNEWSELKADYVARSGPRGGMTLRDHFAGQALAGLTSDASLLTAAQITGPEGIAISAYQIADAMIRQREK
jgi:hypothetical protein